MRIFVNTNSFGKKCRFYIASESQNMKPVSKVQVYIFVQKARVFVPVKSFQLSPVSD
jgi:hypothetical protein